MAADHLRFDLYDALSDAVTVQDPSGELLYANPAAVGLLGFPSRDALLSAPVKDVMGRFVLTDEEGQPFPPERLPGRLALQGLEPPEAVVRWRRRDTQEDRWTSLHARPILDGRGNVVCAVNVFRDITDQRRAQKEIAVRVRQQAAVARLGHRALTDIGLDDLLQEASEVVAVTLDVEFADVLELLPHREALLLRAGVGWKDDLVGTATVGAGSSSQAGFTLLSRSPVIVENLHTEVRFSGPPILHDHGVVSGVTVVIPGLTGPYGVLGAHTASRRRFTRDDIHFLEAVANVLAASVERKKGDEARAGLLEGERRSRELAETARARVAFLAEASAVLTSSLDQDKTMNRVAELAVPRLADWCAVDVLDEDGVLTMAAVAHADPTMLEWAREFRRRHPPARHARIGAPNVVRTGESELYQEVDGDVIQQVATDHRLAPRSAMVVPLTARGRTFGAITFVATGSERRFGPEDLGLAEELGRRAALAIDNARLYRERARIASTLQRSLLPPGLPPIPKMEAAARYHSAGEGVEVGGDFYDLFSLGGGSWIALIGDVCGRGLEAAALTGTARQSLRAVAASERRPSEILRAVNQALIPQSTDLRFCTVACARLDLGGDPIRVTVALGGHPPPMVLRAGGDVEPVGQPGTLLGVFDQPELEDRHVELRPGDALVLYTDGLSDPFEAMDVPTESGLTALLRPLAGQDAAGIAEGLERLALESRTSPSRDDMAILVLRATG
ncbi:MAG TPA: SpoIIE family protein phosphatase [Actinomycetota bacterium]